MTDVAISVANLRVAYGDTEILHGIGFTVAWGEVRGYLGPNGAGKSTTIRALVGLQAPTSGEVRIAGFDPVREAMRARAGFGYVPDAGGLFTLLTPQEHLALVADLHDLARDVAAARIDAMIARFGLAAFLTRRIDTLSKGQRQRVALACGLLHEPRVWLLDEPMDGLDVEGAVALRKAVREHADRGGAVLYCSHVLDVVERLCDRTLILAAGHVVADAPTRELVARSADRRLETVFQQLVRSDAELRRALEA